MNVGAQARTGIKRDAEAHTCYMNAAIQLLYCMSTIRDHVSSMVDPDAQRTKSEKVVAAARVLDDIFRALDAGKTVGPLLSEKTVHVHIAPVEPPPRSPKKGAIAKRKSRKSKPGPKPKPAPAEEETVWNNRARFDALNAGIPYAESPGVMADSSEFLVQLINAILPEVRYVNGEYSNDNKECAIYEREFAECATKRGKTTEEVSAVVAYTLSGLLYGEYEYDKNKQKLVLVKGGKNGSVQDKIDAKRERTFPEPGTDKNGKIKPFDACKDGKYSKLIDFTTDSYSKYVVIPLSRGDNDVRNKAAVDPGRIEFRSSHDANTIHIYDLIGAILYNSYHYIFARTTGKIVDYIYDDDVVYKGQAAKAYMAKKRMSLAVDGVVFLYERIGTKVEARVETTDDRDDSHMRSAIRNGTDQSDPFVVDLTASDDEDEEPTKKGQIVLLDFGSIVRQASAGTLILTQKNTALIEANKKVKKTK